MFIKSFPSAGMNQMKYVIDFTITPVSRVIVNQGLPDTEFAFSEWVNRKGFDKHIVFADRLFIKIFQTPLRIPESRAVDAEGCVCNT